MSDPTPTRQRPRWRTALLSAIGYAVGLGCLIWVFTGVEWSKLWQEMSHARIGWLIAAALLTLLAYVYNSWRWNFLLAPVSRLKLWRTARAFYIGLFSNEILPLRPGELIASYLLAGWNAIPFSVVVSSVALERLLDGISIATAFSIAASFLPLPHYLVVGVRVLAWALAGAAFLLLILLWKRPRGTHLPQGIHRILRPVIEAMRRMTNLRTLLLSLAASFGNLALQVLPYWAVTRSYQLNLSVWAVVAVVIIVRTAVILPNAPGNAGLLQAACILGLGLFGVDKTHALAFVALLFLVVDLPLLVGGAIVAGLSGARIHELRRATAGAAPVDSPSR